MLLTPDNLQAIWLTLKVAALTTLILLLAAFSWMKPLSPSTVPTPAPVVIVSAPMPPSTVASPSPSVIVSASPVAATRSVVA